MSTQPPSATESAPPDLRESLGLLWRRKWVVLATIVVVPVAVYLIASSAQKVYQSSATLQVQAQSVDTSLFTTSAPPLDQTLAAAARLIKTTGVAQEAAKHLQPRPAYPRSLLSKIKVKADSTSGFITITASDPSPKRAADVANAFASAVVITRADSARAQVDQSITQIQRDLGRLARSDTDGRRQLSAQLQRLRALRAAQGDNAQVVEPAVASSSPVSPRPVRSAILALVIALLLGIGLAVALDRLDRKVRDPLEFEELAGTPLLGIVPFSAFPGQRPSVEVPEAFQTLRASLTYFNVNQPLRSVVITSPLKGDGKTTVATNLAAAAARGGKRVLLIDADLRHPQVDARIGPRAEFGLGAVLVDEGALDAALVEVEAAEGDLTILPSGPPPPNPSELLASPRMAGLLSELSAAYDLVILDTPPTLVVSDAIPLFEQASGIVVVGRVNETTKDAMRRLTKVIVTAGGTLLGVVATGASGGGLYGYGGYAGYSERDAGLPSVNGSPGDGRRTGAGLLRGVRGRASARP